MSKMDLQLGRVRIVSMLRLKYNCNLQNQKVFKFVGIVGFFFKVNQNHIKLSLFSSTIIRKYLQRIFVETLALGKRYRFHTKDI